MINAQIATDARTVIHLAEYLEELKTVAQSLRTSLSARTVGFFTPTEDEIGRQLQVSYWQSRAAILEIALAYRDDEPTKRESQHARFLVAYAAAILLVDAARFLRETYGDSDVIQDKLNEPEPHFGIPEGTYDTVMKSLSSPFHAWHLYHAMQYFDDHEQELRALQNDELMAAVLAVVDRLKERLRIPVGTFVKARLRVRTETTLNLVRRRLFARALYGLHKVACLMVSGHYVRPGHRPALPNSIAADIKSIAQPGDIFITRKSHAVTNYFLPGYWPHAALYLGDAKDLERLGIAKHEELIPRWRRLLECDSVEPGRVLEALKDGLWIRSLSSPLENDAIAILRPQLNRSDIAQALSRGMFHEGKPYDFDFDFTRADRLVCTEIVYRSYESIGGISFSLSRRAGRLTLAAEDLIRMALDRTHFEPVAAFAPDLSPQLHDGMAADALLRTSLESSDKPHSE